MTRISLLILALVISLNSHAKTDPLGPIFTDPDDTPKGKNVLIGRYLYVGELPKFQSSDLELYISKMSLTVRVKAWVSPEKKDNYIIELMERWKRIHDAFKSPTLSFVQLKDPETVILKTKSSREKAMIRALSQYMGHYLDRSGENLYQEGLSVEEYKKVVLRAMLKIFTFNMFSTLDEGLSFYNRLKANPSNYKQMSHQVFNELLNKSFTPSSEKSNYIGFLTAVYPISATTKGPFVNNPSPGYYELGEQWGSKDSRWWSEKWKHAYGGFPFLNITSTAVAFHGPITYYRGKQNMWFLQRGFVSHGCHRMDPSDIIEMWTALPDGLPRRSSRVPSYIMTWPDVTDIDNDDRLEVIDVEYYSLPSRVSIPRGTTWEKAAAVWDKSLQQKKFWKSKWAVHNKKLSSNNVFDLETQTFSGLPIYKRVGRTLQIEKYTGVVSVKVLEHRKTRVLQYFEKGIKRTGHEDSAGKYPPRYFNK